MRFDNQDVEERVIGVVARIAGVPARHIKPGVRLRELGCDEAKVLDLIDVLEQVLDLELEIRWNRDLGLPLCLNTVWDIVKLFHRARHGGLDSARLSVRVGELWLQL